LGTTAFTARVRLIVPGILCLFASSPVWAETQTLALPQLVEFSLQNNGELKSFREEKGIHDAVKTRSGLWPNPALELEGGTGALTGNNVEKSLSLGVSQEFFLAGKREKRLDVAERELDMYRWQLADQERVLRAEVKRAFYDVILSEQQVALSDRSIVLNRQLLEVTKERLAAGDIPELEANLVKVELARSEGARIELERSLQQNQEILWTLIGLPLVDEAAIEGDLLTEISMTRNLRELKELALGNRPDLKALEAEKSRGESDIILAKAEGIPNLTAGLAFTRDTTANEVGGVEGKETTDTISLKLSIPIPLFDKNQAGIQEARAKQNSSASRLLAAVKTIEREVETAHASFLNAEKILSLYRIDIIPQLEENLKLTEEAYRLGEVDILTVIQEEKKFFEVNDSYLSARYNRQLALVRLEAAVANDFNGGVK